LDRRFHAEAIQNEFADVAAVPFEDTTGSRVFSRRHFKRYARDLFGYAALKPSCNLIRRSYLLPRLACVNLVASIWQMQRFGYLNLLLRISFKSIESSKGMQQRTGVYLCRHLVQEAGE
jgi:hypothetical protein